MRLLKKRGLFLVSGKNIICHKKMSFDLPFCPREPKLEFHR
uniref:Uncharacterized protein n=1 Tax=uncultured nuHF1 cluster bacterium HF0130_31E21 TaxID=710728 RepID=E0XTK4_9BACT|nr:hypothetical protein [uncultured nuHF1 cluster bacterium HF0130_31E21]